MSYRVLKEDLELTVKVFAFAKMVLIVIKCTENASAFLVSLVPGVWTSVQIADGGWNAGTGVLVSGTKP